MLRNAFANLATNCGNEHAAELMNQLKVTQVPDIAIEDRQWAVEQIESQVRGTIN